MLLHYSPSRGRPPDPRATRYSALNLILWVGLTLGLAACQNNPDNDTPPDLVESSSLSTLTWSRSGVSIPTYTIHNNGGALSNCHVLVAKPLPLGLRVSTSNDRRHCEITGTPRTLSSPIGEVRQNIYAANRFGIDSVEVVILPPR